MDAATTTGQEVEKRLKTTREPVPPETPLVGEPARDAIPFDETAMLALAMSPKFQTALKEIVQDVVRDYLREEIIAVLKSEGFVSGTLTNGSDAEQMQNVMELIDKRLVQQIRADAFRRPAAATNARL